VPTRANAQPAFGLYVEDGRVPPTALPAGFIVLTLADDRIAAVVRFLDTGILPLFGLPAALAD
jgi:RNA polymerase sigma-70 factor (ECF subfamily)